MLSKTRTTPIRSPAPGVIPDTITGPVRNGSPVATDPELPPRSLPPRPTGRHGVIAPAAKPTGLDCTATRSWPSPWSRS